jgi:hypothetical protein
VCFCIATILHRFSDFEKVTMDVSLAFAGLPLYENAFAVFEAVIGISIKHLARDQLSGAPGEQRQNLKCLRSQLDPGAVLVQFARVGVRLERPKPQKSRIWQLRTGPKYSVQEEGFHPKNGRRFEHEL